MQVANAARLFVLKGLWEGTRLPGFGRSLVRALASSDPNVRNIAGILLVRGGAKAVPLLLQGLKENQAPEMILNVLGDVGGPESKPDILPFAKSQDVRIAEAARDAIASIDARLRYQSHRRTS